LSDYRGKNAVVINRRRRRGLQQPGPLISRSAELRVGGRDPVVISAMVGALQAWKQQLANIRC
jgi:hypothetical protein